MRLPDARTRASTVAVSASAAVARPAPPVPGDIPVPVPVPGDEPGDDIFQSSPQHGDEHRGMSVFGVALGKDANAKVECEFRRGALEEGDARGGGEGYGDEYSPSFDVQDASALAEHV